MKTANLTIDMNQGQTEDGRTFGYVHGEDGGFFFTWMPTLAETLESVEEDEQDGDGGLTVEEARKALKEKIASKF
jgi:hypothetical protein